MTNTDPVYDALGITPPDLEDDDIEQKQLPIRMKDTDDSSVDDDFKYARENLYMIIENGHKALEELTNVAQQGQQARAYEVVATLIKTISDANQSLLDLRKQMHEIKNPKDGRAASGDVNNNFIITTADITAMLPSAARQRILDVTPEKGNAPD